MSWRDRLIQQDDDARASRSDAEYLDAVRETMDDDDDCLTTFVGFGLAVAILLQTVLQFV